MPLSKRRWISTHYEVITLQIWCDCRYEPIPLELDCVFDHTLTKNQDGDFSLDGNKLIHNKTVVGHAFSIDDNDSFVKISNLCSPFSIFQTYTK